MANSKLKFDPERVANVKEECKQILFPWVDVFDNEIITWLEVFSRSRNTVKEIMIGPILSVVSGLLGPGVKIQTTYKEPVNIFLVCLVEPHAGKTQALKESCQYPVVDNLEPKIDKQIVLQNFTSSGIRQHLHLSNGRGILASDEFHTLLSDIINCKKKDTIDLGRLALFHDSSTWMYTTAKEKKRVCVSVNPIVTHHNMRNL